MFRHMTGTAYVCQCRPSALDASHTSLFAQFQPRGYAAIIARYPRSPGSFVISKCQMTKPGIARSTGVGADHAARSYRESASGVAERIRTLLVAASHPLAPELMCQSFAVGSCSITSVGDTAS